MIIKAGKDFAPCPELASVRAVCVDVTPLETHQTDYGPKESFYIVFEVDCLDTENVKQGEAPRPYAVWSKRMSPTLNPKSNLRKFLKQWFGRDLTAEEMAGFDSESLIGRPATITVVQEESEGKVFANIALCLPYKGADPMAPSGKFTRKKDRPAKDDGKGDYKRTQAQPAAAPAAQTATASTTEAPSALATGVEYGKLKVHVGAFKGIALEDMDMTQIKRLIDGWLPKAEANPKPTADDRRLIAALKYFQAQSAAPAPAKEEDDISY